MKKKTLYLFFALLLINYTSKSQAVSFLDPGQAFLKMRLEIDDQTFTRIGNYKVTGTQYLFGNQVVGDIHTDVQVGKSVAISYNTYNQTLEIPFENGFLAKKANEVDSFTFLKGDVTFFKEDLHFISTKKFNVKKDFFLLKVFEGPKYSLYKHYFSDLGIVSTNYVQSDLRQFNLKFEYYYFDHNLPEIKLQKLKTNKTTLSKIFSFSNEVLGLIKGDDFDGNKEDYLKILFLKINK